MAQVFGYSLGWNICGEYFLAGEHTLCDSGVKLKSYLLTPYRELALNSQEKYNYSHKKTRVLIEKTLGDVREDFIAFMARFE